MTRGGVVCYHFIKNDRVQDFVLGTKTLEDVLMKGFLKKTMTMILSVTVMLGCSACVKESGEKVDSEKMQLYVYNYDGGYGTTWLNAAKERYEELHKDDKYGDKTGVQIMVTPGKESLDSNLVKTNTHEIYFTESVDYYSYVNDDAFLDITDVYTTENPYDSNKKVIDKLDNAQKSYYNDNGKYYALPGYSGYFGIVYNIEIFDEMGYYLKKDADFNDASREFEDNFTSEASEKSDGPDGKFGTDDDGLPVTYDEFFMICKRMIQTGVTPLVWSGMYAQKHLNGLLHSLVAEAEGADQMMLMYSMDGTAMDLGTVVDGDFVKDTESTTITSKNAYELARRKGNYDALTFINKLINDTVDGEHYYYKNSFSQTFSHTNAQETYLKEGRVNNNNKIAMLVDGVWWESEATDVFNNLTTQYGDKYSKSNMKFGWMPLPKADKDDNGVTLVEDMYSCSFVKSTITEEKKTLAIDFLKFIYSESELAQFTVVTDTPRAVNYTMSSEDLSKMSTYGRSLFNLKSSSNVVNPLNKNSVFVNNQTFFTDNSVSGYYKSNVLEGKNRTTYSNAVSAFKDHAGTCNPANYFEGMYNFLKNSNIWEK